MHVVFSLPADIWRENILAFLALKDIVRSFNAFSNHDVYKQFGTFTGGHTLASPMSVASGQAEMLKWCTSKNVFFGDLTLWDTLDLQTASFLPKVCERATALDYWNQAVQPFFCPRLHRLELFKCSFSSGANLVVFSNLKILRLYGCSDLTSESLMNSLAECKQLTECTINACNLIVDKVITYILNRFTRLESLQLRGTHVHQYSLASISTSCNRQTHPSLRNLVIINCSVCREGFRLLAVCFPRLQLLRLMDSGTNLYNSDFDYLMQHCSQLTDLAINGCASVTQAAATESMVPMVAYIQDLSIERCNYISNESVIAKVYRCAHLASLNVAYCTDIHDDTMLQIRRYCMQLQQLNVAGCFQLTDAAFNGPASAFLCMLNVSETNMTGAFYQHTSTVTELYCINCPHINYELVRNMVTYGSSITKLFLDRTGLSVQELMVLSAHMPLVESVRISSSAANDEVVESFVHNCPRLSWLDVRKCVAVTTETVRELKQTRTISIVI